MSRVVLKNFDGEIPRIEGHYLPDRNAMEAANCKLTNGCLRPMRNGLTIETGLTDVRGIVYHDNQWFTWQQRVDAVPGPVDADRLYLTRQPQEPQLYANGAWMNLHFGNPTVRPSRTWTGTASETAETVHYAYTFVSDLGEETGPSPLTYGTSFSDGMTITISGMPTAATMLNRTITNKRIYRSQTSAAGITDLYFIAEIPQAQADFTDTWGDFDIQEPCPTKDHQPVHTNLGGLTSMANGIMAGFSNKRLYFCEPYMPHSWPQKYSLTLDFNIMGLVAIGTSLVVLTDGKPYIVQGLHPESMASQRVETTYPCVSRDSIVDMGYSAIYASTDGLVQISEAGAQIISEKLWSKDDWANLRPHQFRAGRFGNAYIFSCVPIGSGWARTVFTINLDGEQPALTRTNIPVEFFYNDPRTNDLYHVPVTRVTIEQYDAGSTMDYVWKSKLFRFSDPISFSAFLLDLVGDGSPNHDSELHIEWQDRFFAVLDNAVWTNADATKADLTVDYPPASIVAQDDNTATIDLLDHVSPEQFTFKIYGDGSLIHSVSAGGNQIQRIPAGEYREWQFAIEGRADVLRVVIGESANEVWV